jgi:hypothetical protein
VSGAEKRAREERRGVRKTRAQLARAEEVRSSEDGMAASSPRPSMAGVLGACGKARRGAKERPREWRE